MHLTVTLEHVRCSPCPVCSYVVRAIVLSVTIWRVRLRPLTGYVPSPTAVGLSGQRTSYLPTTGAYSTAPTTGRTVGPMLAT